MPSVEVAADQSTTETDGWQNAEDLGLADAHAAWAAAARERLLEVAASYGSTTTSKELAEAVQERTRIRTDKAPHTWLHKVLTIVGRENVERDEPLLQALCVNADETVGNKYAPAVLELRGATPDDVEAHAAAERFASYQRFGADLPADGGRAQLTNKVAASRQRVRRAAAAEAVQPVCPTCNMALPSTGECNYCG